MNIYPMKIVTRIALNCLIGIYPEILHLIQQVIITIYYIYMKKVQMSPLNFNSIVNASLKLLIVLMSLS
jgi:hypothetical protein